MAAAVMASPSAIVRPPPISIKKASLSSLPALKTPSSAGPMLPSELPRSPFLSLPKAIKQEEMDLKTPITPPTAYTDFLKALSPAISTPLTATSMKSPLSFSDKSGHLTPISLPSSAGSSTCSCKSDNSSGNTNNNKAVPASAPLCPPTPFVRPSLSRTPSARTPTTLRKLRIPQSPGSRISQSPVSTTPISATPKSATILRSPFSPTSWYIAGETKMYGGAPLSAGPRPMSVRQVVTKTVTYRATALDPAPRGKRRKVAS